MKLSITQLGVPKQIQTSKGVAEKNYLKAQEYGDKYLNFWLNTTTRASQIGQTIEVDNVEERDYTAKDGSLKKSYDIKLINKEMNIAKQLEEINGRVLKILMYVEEIGRKLPKQKSDEPDYPEFGDEPNFDTHDLPKDLKDANEHNN